MALRNLAQNDTFQGQVFYTFQQNEGRGQREKFWWCGAGENLAMSYVFFPKDLKASAGFGLNMKVSLAVREVVQSYLTETVTIKWPNDIYIQDKKVGGILVQTTLKGPKVEHVVIGIGVNVNASSFPTELPNPSSIFLFTDKKLDLHQLCVRIALALDEALIKSIGMDGLRGRYEEHLYLKKVNHLFFVEGHPQMGTIIGVEGDGRLRVMINDREEVFFFGQIVYDKGRDNYNR